MRQSKRHAKPTAAALLARIYRQNLEFKRILLNQMALIRLDIVSERQADRAILRTVTDHAARLLREKETLMRLKDVSAFMAAPLRCEFADNHRPNHRCHACGHLQISEDNYNPAWHRPDEALKCDHRWDSPASTIKWAVYRNENTHQCNVCNRYFERGGDPRGMTDSELLAAQHRVIVNNASCSCALAWKHTDPMPLCPVCQIIKLYNQRTEEYEHQT